jgi:hypothetical protein
VIPDGGLCRPAPGSVTINPPFKGASDSESSLASKCTDNNFAPRSERAESCERDREAGSHISLRASAGDFCQSRTARLLQFGCQATA